MCQQEKNVEGGLKGGGNGRGGAGDRMYLLQLCQALTSAGCITHTVCSHLSLFQTLTLLQQLILVAEIT